MELFRALRIQRQDVVALVGGGGKTSAMFRLGDELAAQGWRVVLTSSTHLSAEQVAQAPHIIVRPPDRLPRQLLSHRTTLLIGRIDPRTNRAAGLAPEVIDRIVPVLGVDAVISEADGARRLPFKAPADHEPVIPDSTTLVVPVVGIDAIGQPLDRQHVHRPERIAALTEAAWRQPVTVEMVATVLGHPYGGLKDVPPNARVVVLVNKVHGESQAARRLADLLLDIPRIDAVAIGAVAIGAVAIGSAQAVDPIHIVRGRVAAVVLAAGASRRFGRLKQLEPWGEGGTLLTHAVDVALASQADPVIVVLGCQAEACRAAVGPRPVQIVHNADWAQGQSTSMQAGLAALPENSSAVLFHLADQPGVTPTAIETLIARHQATLSPVVWPEHQGRRGNPVLFDRIAFSALREVTGDVGGKPVLMAYAQAGVDERVAVDEAGILLDIDTPEDLPLE